MASSERSIFRENAIKKYRQRQEQAVLLRVISPPAFMFFWIVLLFFLGAAVLAWSVQMPIIVAGQGVVVEEATAGQRGQEVVAVLFFPPERRADLRVGQPAQVSIGPTEISLTSFIEHVAADLIGPSEARTRFALQGALAQVITGPAVLVIIPLGPASSAHVYVGSFCSAQVHIGSQNVLSLFPILKK
jgi:hypothetical protein